MQVDFDRLSKYHAEGKLRHSVSPGGDLHVWCYSQATVFARDWDDLTLLCRGLVTDGEGTVVSRPFPKFFNWGEPLAPDETVTQAPFWAYDKVDGSLIVVGLRDGEAVVSTKGSFTTWHSEAARALLQGWKPVEGSTAIFELIHPDNRIVIDYGGREELILLGAVANETGEDHFRPDDYAEESGWIGETVHPRSFNLHNMLQSIQDPEAGPDREGFVLLWPNPDGPSPRVKMKFIQYINLHRALSRLSNVAVWEALSTGLFDALLEVVPDEMYDQVRDCSNELSKAFMAIEVECMLYLEQARELPDRKAQAEFLKDIKYKSVVFKMIDGKVWDHLIWKEIKPERDQSWTFLK